MKNPVKSPFFRSLWIFC